MTSTKHAPNISTSGDTSSWTKDFLNTEVELEKFDRQTGRQYLPMDVYVDPKTVNEHFQFHHVST